MPPTDRAGDQPGQVGPQPVHDIGRPPAPRGPYRCRDDPHDVGLAVLTDRDVDHVGVEQTPLPGLRIVADRQHRDVVVGAQPFDEVVDERDRP